MRHSQSRVFPVPFLVNEKMRPAFPISTRLAKVERHTLLGRIYEIS